MPIHTDDFSYIQNLVHQRSAIVIETGKEYLVESRLLPLLRHEGFDSLSSLVRALRLRGYDGLHQKVVEAMTTNETSWFRDFHPFETLKKEIIPDMMKKRSATRALNIWCAACSSGQEPYSIAILLREHFPALASWKVRILATDLSSEMVTRARLGKYNQIEINRGLPAPILVKYFSMYGPEWTIKDDLRRLMEFRVLNLADTWPPMGDMDIVFLRNVLIYFNIQTKKEIFSKLRRLLRMDGYLFLGSAETTFNLDDSFERTQFDKTGCYRRRA
jgi:chemotaxis protein methyltransferase CheR